MVKIAFLGDIMPGGVHSGTSNKYISSELKTFLSEFDLRVGTLESAIGDSFSFDTHKIESNVYDIVYSKDKDIDKLTDLNIDIVSLANNHIFDLDIDGFKNTLYQLDKAGIKHCGAGINIEKASKPVLLEIKGERLAVFAYCKHQGWSSKLRVATDETPGINPLIEDNIIKDISDYKTKGYKVCLLLHWSNEHTIWPANKDRVTAKLLMKTGADIIIGSHAHHVQPRLKYKNNNTFFNLGNFLFPDRYITEPRVTYYPEKSENVETFPVIIDFRKVKEPTLKLWKSTARCGMIADIQINGKKIIAKQHLTNLTEANLLEFADTNTTRALNYKLRAVTMLLRLPFYSFSLFSRRVFNFINRKIK